VSRVVAPIGILTLILAVARPLVAQSIDVTAGASASMAMNGVNVAAWGEAQFLTATGFPAQVGLTGNLTLFEEGDIVVYKPWTAPTGHWTDSIANYSGYFDACYRSAVVAQSAAMSTTVYSEPQCVPTPAPRQQHGYDLCPLILDLNGDGIATTGAASPVVFADIDGDDSPDATGWTNPSTEEGFLWLDLNESHSVDRGELFGSRMPLPDGTLARNGYEALDVYDLSQYGGNEDALITRADSIWRRLRLWVDRDHNGRSSQKETSVLSAWRIVELSLARNTVHRYDGQLNVLMFAGSYRLKVSGDGVHEIVPRRMADILFFTPHP
jgi:hypothetical protein